MPSLYSSADKAHRGSITKAGNRHIRRVLVQTSWQYRHRPGVGPKLRARREGQPGRVLTIADNAQRRLCTRYRRLTERGKTPNKVVIAIARELVGFLWAALKEPAATTIATPTIPRTEPAIATRAKALSGPAVGQRRKARKEKRAS